MGAGFHLVARRGSAVAIRVFVSGASGNVGRLVTGAVREAADLELVGGWCREAGEDLGLLAGQAAAGIAAAVFICNLIYG
jgi:4-hydroxy-tetrahydrodipicolinate reductase